MSTKIQILNEKQVDHYADVLLPKLLDKFHEKTNELKELAKLKVNTFIVTPEVTTLKEKHAKQIELAHKTVAITKQLKELGDDYSIQKANQYRVDIVRTTEELEELLGKQQKEVDELLLELAEVSYNVNAIWTRRTNMSNELRARLSMTAVSSFEIIEKSILESIDIINFFTNPITE